MQCPTCSFEATQAEFGDPMRCPDCGVYYQKALAHKLRKEGGTQVRAPSVESAGAAAEKVFFEAHGVRVTNTRFIVQQQTFAMSSVNSVKVGVTDKTPPNSTPLAMIVIGALWLLALFGSTPHKLGAYVIPLALIGAGIYWIRSIKKAFEYKIVLTTSSGETTALTSSSEPDIRVVEAALNDAIVYRG